MCCPPWLLTWFKLSSNYFLASNAGQLFLLLLGKTKVNQGHNAALTTDAHQEVVRHEVAVDEPLAVHELDPVDHLVGKHEDSLGGELV